MKKFEKLEILKNVGSSWFALGINVLVGIFLSPYILHRLGDEAFGLWVLIFSITGYYGLFDVGIRASIVRYVASHLATEDFEELNRLINTAMLAYGAVGVFALIVTISGAFYVDSIFHISPGIVGIARLLFLIVGTALSLGFPMAVFGGILEGLQRFYLMNLTSTSSTLVRAVLIIITLQHGGGLLGVAAITVSLPLLAALVNGGVVLHLLPLRFGPKYVNRGSLKRITNYSAPVFMLMLAARLRFKSDAMVIGTFLSATAITYFAVGSRLVDYAGEVVLSMAQIFAPMSSQSTATGDMERLRKIFVAGNRACALIIFPIAAMLIVLGKSIIEAWVGRRYVATSYPVLLVLVIPSIFMYAQSASGRILFGMAKHQTLAVVTLLEGVANVVLSIILVRRFGILGDAVGTAIPLTCTTLWFLPRHLCRILNLRVREYLSQAFLLPLALTLPLIVVLLLLRQWFIAHTYLQLAGQLAIGASVYSLALAWATWTRRIWKTEGLRDTDIAAEIPIVAESYQD